MAGGRSSVSEDRSWWRDKPNSAFGQNSILGIPHWIEDIGSPRITAHPSKHAEYAKVDGETILRWYFAPDYITFFLSADVTQTEADRLRRALSDPNWSERGKYGGPRFRVHDEADLRAVKEFILNRLDTEEHRRAQLLD